MATLKKEYSRPTLRQIQLTREQAERLFPAQRELIEKIEFQAVRR